MSARGGGVGKASGFVDGVSSVGQLFSSYLVGYIAQKYGWDNLFYVFVVLALLGGAIMATRWSKHTIRNMEQPEDRPEIAGDKT
jgi:sugar phosphate permease